MTQTELDKLFTHHAPTPSQIARIGTIRSYGLALATCVIMYSQPGPDQSTAIRKIREAVMTANAAIVLEEDEGKLDAIQANAFTDFFALIGRGFVKVFGGLFTDAQVKQQAALIADFITTDVGKLALSAVEYVEETTVSLATGATDAEKKAAAIAKRDAALVTLKADAAAAGKDLTSLAGSTLIWFVETALQYVVAKGLSAAASVVLHAGGDDTESKAATA